MLNNRLSSSLILIAFLAISCSNNSNVKLETVEDKFLYINGFNMGEQAKQNGMDMNPDVVYAGIKDSIDGKESKIKEEEIPKILQEFFEKSKEKQSAIAEQNKKDSEQFLIDNAKKEGVQTTKSGLQYQVLTAKPTGAKPSVKDQVKVHYHGTLINGTVFDSSVERGEPVVFATNEVIPGWTEGLQLMKVGEKFKFFIPSSLAYGEHQAGPILPHSALIFEVELLDIEKAASKK